MDSVTLTAPVRKVGDALLLSCLAACGRQTEPRLPDSRFTSFSCAEMAPAGALREVLPAPTPAQPLQVASGAWTPGEMGTSTHQMSPPGFLALTHFPCTLCSSPCHVQPPSYPQRTSESVTHGNRTLRKTWASGHFNTSRP